MNISDFKGKRIVVLGVGVEGFSSAEFLKEKGADVTILDESPKPDEGLVAKAKDLNITCKFGSDAFGDFSPYDIIVRSPGIRLSHAALNSLPREKITSQTKLFFDLCPCSIIGVTGTKGKGTTASLIFEMLKAAGKDTYLGGNIGTPPLEFLNNLTKDSWVVLELSSFQLQDIHKSPHIAILLMVTSEHLDYHSDTYEYVDAKRNILRFQTQQDFAVINRDYLASHESDMYTDAQVFQVSRELGVADRGCFIKDSAVWIQKDGREKKVIDTKDILLPGRHNLENVCAAAMAAFLADVPIKDIKQVLHTFSGLPHRLELVREVNGVRYYDDSFSTTPETAIAAIEAFDASEILILGGSSKGADFSTLGEAINKAKNIKAIVGVGTEWPKIKAAITNQAILLIEGAKDMKTIVAAASKIVQPGNVVLLSPACASFDMFKNYKDRGEQFKVEVSKL